MRTIMALLTALVIAAFAAGCVTKNRNPDPARNKAQAREAVDDMNRAFNQTGAP